MSLSKRVDCGTQVCDCLLWFKSVQRTFGGHLFKITYSVGLTLDGPMWNERRNLCNVDLIVEQSCSKLALVNILSLKL
jgi:hypothetical protein